MAPLKVMRCTVANSYSSVPNESDMRYTKMPWGSRPGRERGAEGEDGMLVVQSQATAFGSRDKGWQVFMSALLL